MKNPFKFLTLTIALCSTQPTWADPQADARYIAERTLSTEMLTFMEHRIKNAFVSVYYMPLTGSGITIADREAFIGIIPDKDAAPYLDRFLILSAKTYLERFEPEELRIIAGVLRSDETATVGDILEKDYQRRYEVALEEARANTQGSGVDDPTIIALEELIVQVNALNILFESDGAEAFAQTFVVGLAPLFTMIIFNQEIQNIRKEPNNPVTRSALETDGILKFANPVQRQTLLRQISTAPDTNTGGINFIRPPANNTD